MITVPRPGEDGEPQSISEDCVNLVIATAAGFLLSMVIFTVVPCSIQGAASVTDSGAHP